MTDEQLAAWEVEAAESCGLGTDDSLALIAEVRRLRELERACRALWRRHPDGRRYLAWQGAMSAEEQEAAATIGRLLEEPKEASGE